MEICILGAGIAGLATAYELNRAGHQVTVVDGAAPGSGASGGNGAQLSYSYVQPLADASLWMQLPKLLLSPTSPLRLRPQWDVHQWAWCLQFMAACNSHTSRQSTVALLALAAASRSGFDAMRADIQPDCDFLSAGKLVLYPTAKALAHANRQVELQRSLGSQQAVVTAQQCVHIEPALASYSSQIAGAVHTPSECSADCQKVCNALVVALRARGVRFLLGNRITAITLQKNHDVASLETSQGAVKAERYVMALGAGSYHLARTVGVRLPVYPLKGYSITAALSDPLHTGPSVSVTDSARKVVFARLGSRLRIAGMAELVGYGSAIPRQRIETLVAAAQAVFPGCVDGADLNPWTGMRPATPTGLPVVGSLRGAPANLLFNTGHGALGFTLAFGTAARIAAQVQKPTYAAPP